MNTRTKLLTASAGVLLLAGVGGTLALWSASADGDALYAATGHLNVAITGEPAAWDISDQCQPTLDAGAINWLNCNPANGGTARLLPVSHDTQGVYLDGEDETLSGVISLNTDNWDPFLMVPGDTIRVAAPVAVDLAGTNIAAELIVNADAPSAAFTTAISDNTTVQVDPANNKAIVAFSGTDPVGLPQFTVTTVGLYKATTAADALTASGTTGGRVFFVPSDTDNEAWAVYDVHFIDFNSQKDLLAAFPTGTYTAAKPAVPADGDTPAVPATQATFTYGGVTYNLGTIGQNDSNGATGTCSVTDDAKNPITTSAACLAADGTWTPAPDLMDLGWDVNSASGESTSTYDADTLLNVINGLDVILIQTRPVAS